MSSSAGALGPPLLPHEEPSSLKQPKLGGGGEGGGGSGQDTERPSILTASFIHGERAAREHLWIPIQGALLGNVRAGIRPRSGRPPSASASESGFC